MSWNGGIAQLGEHLPCKQGVKGSNPFISTAENKFRWLFFENCILNILNKLKKFRHPRCDMYW